MALRCITCTLIEIFVKISALFNAKLTYVFVFVNISSLVFVFVNISSLVSKLAAYFARMLAALVFTKKQT